MPLITAITVNCEHVDHLEYAGVEDNHDETGDVERAKGGVDYELRVVETTEVYLYHDYNNDTEGDDEEVEGDTFDKEMMIMRRLGG